MNRVSVKPALLRWARERSGRSIDELRRRFPKFDSWERGEVLPTLKQLETFANTTHTPIGYLFLTDPPEEKLPVTDFRTPQQGRQRESKRGCTRQQTIGAGSRVEHTGGPNFLYRVLQNVGSQKAIHV